MENELYNGNGRLESAKKRLENSDITNKDKKLIEEWVLFISTRDDFDCKTAAKHYDILRVIREKVGRNFMSMAMDDIQKFISELNNSDLSDETKTRYRQLFKRFIKWLYIKNNKFKDYGLQSYPEIVAWINNRTKEKNRNKITREQIPEQEDVLKMLNVIESSKWRAIVWILFELGLRAGEILNLKYRDIKPSDYGFKIKIEFGKTGSRGPLPLIQGAPDVASYLNSQVSKNPDDLLFPITLMHLNRKLKYFAYKAGIKNKIISSKIFRKSAATYKAQFMTSQQMKEFFGWKRIETSEAYVRTCPKDIENAILKINGLEVDDKGTMIKFITCVKCNTRHYSNEKFCKCGFPLTAETVQQIENESRDRIKSMIVEVLKTNPQLTQTGSVFAPQIQQEIGEGYLDIGSKYKITKDGWVIQNK